MPRTKSTVGDVTPLIQGPGYFAAHQLVRQEWRQAVINAKDRERELKESGIVWTQPRSATALRHLSADVGGFLIRAGLWLQGLGSATTHPTP